MNEVGTTFFCVGMEAVDPVIVVLHNISLRLTKNDCVYLSENGGSYISKFQLHMVQTWLL